MKGLAIAAVAALALPAFAQQTTTTTTTTTTITTQIVENVVVQQSAEPKKVAVFVQNRTRVPGMDDEVDGIRDRLAAALAATDAVIVMDSAEVADSFARWKVTTEEEKRGLVAGVFTGGSVPRVAQMLGCDYVVAASVVGATAMPRNVGATPSTVYTLRMTLKATDATGASVFAMPPWSRQMPIAGPAGDAMQFYNMLIDQWAEDAGAAVANSAAKWRRPAEAAAEVAFTVTTTIDGVVGELESQTKGVKEEQLQELRKVVGGATVEIDGAVLGSAPGEFRAAPGLHTLVVKREWMKPYAAKVMVRDGANFNIALEMSEEGISKWGGVEALRADVAKRYAEAAMKRGVKVNIDTAGWHDVGENTAKMVIEKANGQ